MNGIFTLSHGPAAALHHAAEHDVLVWRRPDAGHHRSQRGPGQRPDNRSLVRYVAVLAAERFHFRNHGAKPSDLRNQGAKNVDFSLFKRFPVTERVRLEFRGEAFNLMNTPLFAAPGTTVNTPTFGVVTTQENSPRQVQLGLKILFSRAGILAGEPA